MDTNGHEIIHKELAHLIVGAAMDVCRALGSGFLEKVYENAFAVALTERGTSFEQQANVCVPFHGHVVGVYVADILVEDSVIVELKTVDAITDVHRAQAINYLRGTGLRLAILLNFAGPKLQWERIVL